jgi:hypothetical protein
VIAKQLLEQRKRERDPAQGRVPFRPAVATGAVFDLYARQQAEDGDPRPSSRRVHYFGGVKYALSNR